MVGDKAAQNLGEQERKRYSKPYLKEYGSIHGMTQTTLLAPGAADGGIKILQKTA